MTSPKPLTTCTYPDCAELVEETRCEHHPKKRNRGKRRNGHRKIPKGMRKEVLTRDGHECRLCGTKKDLTLDHRHPLSLGGPTEPANLWTLCRPCHNLKDGMGPHTPPEEKDAQTEVA